MLVRELPDVRLVPEWTDIGGSKGLREREEMRRRIVDYQKRQKRKKNCSASRWAIAQSLFLLGASLSSSPAPQPSLPGSYGTRRTCESESDSIWPLSHSASRRRDERESKCVQNYFGRLTFPITTRPSPHAEPNGKSISIGRERGS